ncbi:MAG: hypothetical protein GF375_07335 [Candidatus Omnitrophica bacterium]|nr:hypothetical protein [Candidatus Omnitrophota bacterium]MBD3269782.1 hypothetical protein [Candidatus Omnitrophota bacterium]
MQKFKIILLAAMLLFTGCTTFLYEKGAYEKSSGESPAVPSSTEGRVKIREAGDVKTKEEEDKICPVCGREFPASVKYCPYDGTELF